MFERVTNKYGHPHVVSLRIATTVEARHSPIWSATYEKSSADASDGEWWQSLKPAGDILSKCVPCILTMLLKKIGNFFVFAMHMLEKKE